MARAPAFRDFIPEKVLVAGKLKNKAKAKSVTESAPVQKRVPVSRQRQPTNKEWKLLFKAIGRRLGASRGR